MPNILTFQLILDTPKSFLNAFVSSWQKRAIGANDLSSYDYSDADGPLTAAASMSG